MSDVVVLSAMSGVSYSTWYKYRKRQMGITNKMKNQLRMFLDLVETGCCTIVGKH